MEKSISDQVISLLEKYSFDELSSQQVDLILAEMSEQEYRAHYLLIAETQLLSAEQQLNAPSSIHENIHAQLSGQFAKPQGGLMNILTAGIPLWLAVILGGGAVILTALWFGQAKSLKEDVPLVNKEQSKIEYVYISDTIYQEIKSEPIVVTKVVKEEIIKYVEIEVPAKNNQEAVYVAGSQKELGLTPILAWEEAFESDDEAIELAVNQKGQSVAEDRALMELLDNFQE